MAEGSVPNGGRLRVVLFYVLATLLAFPITETVFRGTDARHFGFDVFDDGSVPHLGGWSALFSAHGPVLWNPLLTTGNAAFAQFTATPLALDSLVALVLPPFPTYVLFLALIVFAAGLSMHVFLEESVGLSREASAIGALLLMFGFKHYNIGFPPVLIPLILWISDRAANAASGRSKWVAYGAATAAFSLYNGVSQAAVIGAGIHLVYAVAVPSTAADRRFRVLDWLAVWGLGFALFGPVLITQAVLLPDSVRAIRDTRHWLPDVWAGVQAFGRAYAELVVGRPPMSAGGVNMETAYGTLYPGCVALLIFLLSVGQARKNRRELTITWLLLLIPLIDLLALTAGPGVEKHLGLLRSFNFSRIRLFLPFALAANVAIAVSLSRERVEASQFRRSAAMIALACVTLSLLQSAVCGRITLYLIRNHGFFPSDVATRERLLGFGLAAWYFFAIAMLIGLAIRAGRRRNVARSSGFATHRLAGLVTPLVFVVLVDRVAYARIERYVEPTYLISFREALGESPAIRFLRSLRNPEGDRILTVANRSRPNREDHPNRLFFHGLSCADGYENIYPLRYHELFGLLTAPSLARTPAAAAEFRAWGQKAYAYGADVNTTIASLAGIRWIYARRMPAPEAPWREVFAEGDERVFENTEVFPRAFVVSGLRRFEDRLRLLSALGRASREELRSMAFVEASDALTETSEVPSRIDASVALRKYGPDRVEIDVGTMRRGILVLTDVWVPGWAAKVNGASANVFPVDCAFRGVEVPAGASRVELAYRPTYTYAGFTLATVGLVVAGLLFVRRSLWNPAS